MKENWIYFHAWITEMWLLLTGERFNKHWLFNAECLCVLSLCLRSWLEQDTSCPTCRMSLNIGEEGGGGRVERETREAAAADNVAAVPGADARPHLNQLNHFFHFDGETVNDTSGDFYQFLFSSIVFFIVCSQTNSSVMFLENKIVRLVKRNAQLPVWQHVKGIVQCSTNWIYDSKGKYLYGKYETEASRWLA